MCVSRGVHLLWFLLALHRWSLQCTHAGIEKRVTDTDTTQWHILRHPKDVDVTFTGDV